MLKPPVWQPAQAVSGKPNAPENEIGAAGRQAETRLIPAAGEGDDLALRRERARAVTIRAFWLSAGFAPPSLRIEFYRGRRGRSPIYGLRSDMLGGLPRRKYPRNLF